MKIEEFRGEWTKGYYITPEGYATDVVAVLTSFRTLLGGPIFSEAVISCNAHASDKIMSETSSEDAAKALAEALQKAIELKDKFDKEHGVGKFAK